MNLAVMYHYVREPDDWKGSVPISPKAFEEQIDHLGKKYEFVLPDDLNKKTAKPKCVLTFDDATRDQYEHAFRIMQRKGVPGYFTVMSGPLAGREVPIFHLVHAALSIFEERYLWEQLHSLLSQPQLLQLNAANDIYGYEPSQLRRYIKYTLNFMWDSRKSRMFLEELVFAHYGSRHKFIADMYIDIEQFRRMKQAGMALGVHCVNHVPYDGNGEEYYRKEIEPCAQFIQEHLNMEPEWYTPPFGGGAQKLSMMENMARILLEKGYKGAFTTMSGFIEDVDSFWLNRIDCNNKQFFEHMM